MELELELELELADLETGWKGLSMFRGLDDGMKLIYSIHGNEKGAREKEHPSSNNR